MKTLLSLLLIILTLSTKSQNTNFSFTNKPISDPELPNYGRGAQFWNGVLWNNGGAPQVPQGNPTAKSGYRRWWWYELESSQGVYTLTGGYPSVEWHLKDLADQGMLLAYGSVMTAYDGGGIFYDGANSVYPQYLHNLMQSEIDTKDWVYTGTNTWVPNWNSPSYIARWKALQQAIYNYVMNWTYVPSSGPWAGKTVRGKDMIESADLRGYGNFGEWHTWPWTDATPTNARMTDSSYVKIVNATKDVWKDVMLHINVAVIDANSWADHNPFRAWYVLTNTNDWGLIGLRDDGIGDPGKWFIANNPWTYGTWRADTAIRNRWKYSLNTGEPLNGNGTCCPLYYDIRNQIVNTAHWSQFGNGNYPNSDQSTFDTMQAVFKLAGYRYNINGGYMTTTLGQNSNFNIVLNWRNVGNGPIYHKRWRVVYQLKNSSDVEIKKWTSKFNIFLYLPDTKDSVVNDIFNLGNVPIGSSYKLTVKIEDTTGLCSPLFLAINSPLRNSDGSYTLRSNITVTSSLPIKWYDFTLVKKDKYNLLNWTTSCDKNNDRFEVERSLDATNFKTISVIKNKDTICDKSNFEYKDYDIVDGITYYRITQIDMDGFKTYSKILNVIRLSSNAIEVYPNPTYNDLFVSINNEIKGTVSLIVYTVDGKQVIKQNYIKIGTTFNTILDVRKLIQGNYFVSIRMNNFNSVSKIFKN